MRSKLPATGAFLLRKHRMDSNLGRGAGVKKTRSVLARGRVRRQAGEAGADPRSGCAESYTPHQLSFKPPETGAFPLRGHCGDSNLVRGASVKKTRSVFSERASPPAGGRSRCGSAQRMRGILYAAPIELEASGNGGFSFMPPLHGFEPRSRRRRKADYFLSTRVRFRVGVAAHP